MSIVTLGACAPAVDGIDLEQGTKLLFFYKVTCPVCQMAAPVAQRIDQAVPGGIVGIGQDPPERLGAFAREYGVAFDSAQDPPP
jgi:peroxiredoxin